MTKKTYYLNPVRGDDKKDGLTPKNAFKTFAAAQAAMTDGAGGVINIAGPACDITERLNITKDGLILRGNTPGILFQPIDDAGDTISVVADRVSLEGFSVTTVPSRSRFFVFRLWYWLRALFRKPRCAVSVTGAGCLMQDITIRGPRRDPQHGVSLAAREHIEIKLGSGFPINVETVTMPGTKGG